MIEKLLPDENVLSYCQRHGLRILAGHAFKYFYEHLYSFPGNYLEIGVFEGFMLRELAMLHPDKHFYGVDSFIEDGNTTGHNGIEKGRETLAQRNATENNLRDMKNVTMIIKTSRQFFEELSDKDMRAMRLSCVFVDGDHSYEEACNDIINAVRALPGGGVILIDDIGLPDVRRAANDAFEGCLSRLIDYRHGDWLVTVSST